MFGPGPATKIYVAAEAVDMRKGFEGLYGLVRDHLGHDPLSGHLFLFTNRTHTRLKALVWDGSGLWVCAKRLERGCFHWPGSHHRRASDSASLFFQLHPTLIEGVYFLLSCFDLSIHLVNPMRAFERSVFQGIV